MAKKKNPANIPAIIITVLAALLAIAAVVFVMFTLRDRDGGTVNINPADGSDSSTTSGAEEFYASQELATEVETAAYKLLPDNYKIYQYFTLGMSYKEEPYGNLPEDGFYTCVNNDFKTFDELCDYIRATFVKETADKLITDPFGYGPVYADDGGELGLSDKFEPNDGSGLSWEDTKFICTPTSETECDIEITLKDKDGKDVVKNVKMVKENDVWLLAEMVG